MKLLVILAAALAATSATRASTLDTKNARVLDPVGYLHYFQSQSLVEKEDSTNNLKKEGSETSAGPMITIDDFGRAQGKYLTSFLGRQFSSFRGIPYANKPERFQYPTPYNTTWNGCEDCDSEAIYDATKFRDRCPQLSLILDDTASGSEDCLHLAIYSPYLNFSTAFAAEELLPVMVFIYGGAFISGESTYYIPTKLLDKDVVVVVIQYRLGSLGFLYSGTDDAPGNMGLMDQITSLQWVKKYIENFGGNSKLVTVFGQSAGGASTSWLQMTPLTQAANNDGEDLVQRFIPMSGSSLEYWALDRSGTEGFYAQVKAIGCDTEQSPSQMVDCMKSKTLSEIVKASISVYHTDRYEGGLGFIGQAPVVQSADITFPRVIPKEPMDIIKDKEFLRAPVMLGATRDEGSLVMGLYYKDYLVPHGYDEDYAFLRDDMLPGIAETFGVIDPTNAIANTMRLAFFPEDVEMGNLDEMMGPLVDLGGTLFLKSGLWSLAHYLTTSNHSDPVYFYSFEFESDDTIFDWMFGNDPNMTVPGGISHADDLLYLFALTSMPDDRETEMVKRMTTLYTNFAKYGNPTPPEVELESEEWESFADEWIPYSAEEKNFMLLSDELTLEHDFVHRWNYNKFGYTDIDQEEESTLTPNTDSRAASNTGEEPAKQGTASGSAVLIVGAVCAGIVVLVVIVAYVAQVRQSRKNSVSLPTTQGNVNFAMDNLNKEGEGN